MAYYLVYLYYRNTLHFLDINMDARSNMYLETVISKPGYQKGMWTNSFILQPLPISIPNNSSLIHITWCIPWFRRCRICFSYTNVHWQCRHPDDFCTANNSSHSLHQLHCVVTSCDSKRGNCMLHTICKTFTNSLGTPISYIDMSISLKFAPEGRINNIPALVQIMAWCRSSDKSLSEPMMVSLLTHICVTRPQCA